MNGQTEARLSRSPMPEVRDTAPGAQVTHERLGELLERLNSIEKLAYEIHMGATGKPPYEPKPAPDAEKRNPAEGFFPFTNEALSQANSKADTIESYLRKVFGEFS